MTRNSSKPKARKSAQSPIVERESKLRDPDLSEIRIVDVPVGTRIIRAKPPLIFKPTLCESGCYIRVEDDRFNLVDSARTRTELIEDLLEVFAFLWEVYALEKDTRLTAGAIRLKQELLAAFEDVGTAA